MKFTIVDEICKYPFIRLVIPLIIGITISLVFSLPSFYGLTISVPCFFLFLLLSLKPHYNFSVFIGILINLIIIGLGIFITSFHLKSNDCDLNAYNSGLLVGEVYDDPKLNGDNTILYINILAINNNDNWSSALGRSILYVDNDEKSEALRVGDRIIFNPDLSAVENKGNPNEFDYKKYLSYNLISSSNYLISDDWHILPKDKNLKLEFSILRFRQTILNALEERGLRDDELAVVSALALGYKDKLSDELRHNYSSSGAMHILAVSGLHVGVIYGLLLFAFSFVKNKRFNYLKIPIIIVFIWFYACLTGLSPSVCRSALMFSIISIGGLRNRTVASLNSVAASAFILLLINPLNLTSVGFQLSYLAVIGIIVIQPKIHQLLTVKNKYLEKLWSLISVSIAAQLAVAPLCIYYFNSFSNYFIITNIFLIPIASITIWIFVLAFLFLKISFISAFIVQILVFIVKAMNFIVGTIESLPYSVCENLHIDLISLILLYLLMFYMLIFFFYSKRFKDLAYSMSIVAILLVISIFDDVETNKQKYLIVYNINKTTAINIIDGRDNILFARIDSTNFDRAKMITKGNWLESGLSKEKYIRLSESGESILNEIVTIDNPAVFHKHNLIAYNDLRLAVLDEKFFPFEPDAKFQKILVDYIVLSNDPFVQLSDLSKYFEYKKVIIDSSNSSFYVEKMIEENEDLSLDIFNVREEGAFVLQI